MFKDLVRLFASSARIKVLKFFVLQPETRAVSSAVADIIGVPKKTVENEMRALVHVGILIRRAQTKATVFTLNNAHSLAAPLRVFFDMTTVPSNTKILEVFRDVRGVTLLVATGILAHEPRGSVDLLIVTKKPRDSRLKRAVKRLEVLLALPLRYAVLEFGDYTGRLESYDRLLRDIFEFEHRIIIGKR